MKTGLGRDTPTTELVVKSGDLSIQQLIAYFTLITVFRVLQSGKPKYLHDKLKIRCPVNNDGIFPHRHTNTIEVPAVQLTLSRSGFIYQGALLYNNLPLQLRQETKVQCFKRSLKRWIFNHIKVKPT